MTVHAPLISNVCDVTLPCSSKDEEEEEEDEVFVGPVGHKERCVAVEVSSRTVDSGLTGVSWSPLTGDELEAMCEEAHRLVGWLQSSKQSCGGTCSEEDKPSSMAADPPAGTEDFCQDAESKLSLFSQPPPALTSIKRETFCVQDSPKKHLPPAIQCRLQRGSSSSSASSSRPASAAAPPRRVSASMKPLGRLPSGRLSSSSPVVKPQPRTGLRGRAALGVVLPSKQAAPTASSSANKSRAETSRLQLPSKVTAVSVLSLVVAPRSQGSAGVCPAALEVTLDDTLLELQQLIESQQTF